MIILTPISLIAAVIYLVLYLRKKEDHYKNLTIAFFALAIASLILNNLIFRWMLR